MKRIPENAPHFLYVLRRSLFAVAIAGALPLLAACPKKDVPGPADAYVAPVVVAPTVDAAPLDLATLLEDAGSDAEVEAAAPHHGSGTASNANQVRARQCCAALSSQAKTMGAGPEANVIQGMVPMCNALAAQVGPSSGGQAPELAPLRAMLKGKTIPPVCQGL